MSMLPNYSRTVFSPRPPLGLHYFCNLRIVIVTNEDTALEGYTPRLRPCFTSRYPCTREVEGDWGTDNGLHPSSLFPNFHGDNAQLCGFGQVTNIINYSNRDIYLYTSDGRLDQVIPATYEFCKPSSVSWNEDHARRPARHDHIPRNPCNPHSYRHGTVDNPFAQEPTYAELEGGVRNGDRLELRNDPWAVLARGSMADRGNILVVELKRLKPVGAKLDTKSKRYVAASNLGSIETRQREIESWTSIIDVPAITNEADQFGGCDAIYHPGLDRYITTNRESVFVGRVDETIFRRLTELEEPIIADYLGPITVFCNDLEPIDEIYYSIDGKRVFSTTPVRSRFIVQGEIRIRLAEVDANGKQFIEPVNISLTNLQMSEYKVLVGATDILISTDLTSLRAFLVEPDDDKYRRTAHPTVDGYMSIDEYQSRTSELRVSNTLLERQISATNLKISSLVNDLKSADPPSIPVILKRLQGAVTDYKPPVASLGPAADTSATGFAAPPGTQTEPPRPSTLEKVTNVSHGVKAVATMTKSFWDIGVVIAGAIGVIAAGAALLKGWLSQRRAPA